MKITIDTAQDSHQDIRNVIRMLQHLVGKADVPKNIFENKPSEDTTGFANFFDSPAPKTEKPEEEPEENKQPEVILY